MIGRRDKGPIDAVDELERADEARIAGERGGSALGNERRGLPAGFKGFLMVGAAVVVMMGVGFTATAAKHHKPKEEKKPEVAKVENLGKGFTPAPVAAEAVPLDENGQPVDARAGAGAIEPIDVAADMEAAKNGASAGTVPALSGTSAAPSGGLSSQASPAPRQPTPAELVHLRRLQPELGNRQQAASAQYGNPTASGDGDDAGRDDGGELARSLRPMRLTGQQAAKLGNRDFLLTQGSMIDCVLQTRLVSTVPGMTSCYLTRDVYSANGKVVLLDRGSKVVGFYQGGLKQGQPRIFVQWSRVETTKGIVINLDSPGTGPLGEGGLDGKIDTHFRERFGGAILLSLIDDFGDYLANKGGKSGQSIQFDNSGDAAKELAKTTLENSINIPPTLYKNQGERVSIFVARDLDFGGVYALARR